MSAAEDSREALDDAALEDGRDRTQLIAVAQVHALLAVAEALEELQPPTPPLSPRSWTPHFTMDPQSGRVWRLGGRPWSEAAAEADRETVSRVWDLLEDPDMHVTVSSVGTMVRVADLRAALRPAQPKDTP